MLERSGVLMSTGAAKANTLGTARAQTGASAASAERRPLAPAREVAIPDRLRAALPPGGGDALPTSVRTQMEARFGEDFGNVRVHTGAEALRNAEARDSNAYTVGSHIVFGVRGFHPQTRDGMRLIAHELAHVVQQRRGGPAPTPAARTQLESHADAAASAVTSSSGGIVPVSGNSGPTVQHDRKRNKRIAEDDDERGGRQTRRPPPRFDDEEENGGPIEHRERAQQKRRTTQRAEDRRNAGKFDEDILFDYAKQQLRRKERRYRQPGAQGRSPSRKAKDLTSFEEWLAIVPDGGTQAVRRKGQFDELQRTPRGKHIEAQGKYAAGGPQLPFMTQLLPKLAYYAQPDYTDPTGPRGRVHVNLKSDRIHCLRQSQAVDRARRHADQALRNSWSMADRDRIVVSYARVPSEEIREAMLLQLFRRNSPIVAVTFGTRMYRRDQFDENAVRARVNARRPGGGAGRGGGRRAGGGGSGGGSSTRSNRRNQARGNTPQQQAAQGQRRRRNQSASGASRAPAQAAPNNASRRAQRTQATPAPSASQSKSGKRNSRRQGGSATAPPATVATATPATPPRASRPPRKQSATNAQTAAPTAGPSSPAGASTKGGRNRKARQNAATPAALPAAAPSTTPATAKKPGTRGGKKAGASSSAPTPARTTPSTPGTAAKKGRQKAAPAAAAPAPSSTPAATPTSSPAVGSKTPRRGRNSNADAAAQAPGTATNVTPGAAPSATAPATQRSRDKKASVAAPVEPTTQAPTGARLDDANAATPPTSAALPVKPARKKPSRSSAAQVATPAEQAQPQANPRPKRRQQRKNAGAAQPEQAQPAPATSHVPASSAAVSPEASKPPTPTAPTLTPAPAQSKPPSKPKAKRAPTTPASPTPPVTAPTSKPVAAPEPTRAAPPPKAPEAPTRAPAPSGAKPKVSVKATASGSPITGGKGPGIQSLRNSQTTSHFNDQVKVTVQEVTGDILKPYLVTTRITLRGEVGLAAMSSKGGAHASVSGTHSIAFGTPMSEQEKNAYLDAIAHGRGGPQPELSIVQLIASGDLARAAEVIDRAQGALANTGHTPAVAGSFAESDSEVNASAGASVARTQGRGAFGGHLQLSSGGGIRRLSTALGEQEMITVAVSDRSGAAGGGSLGYGVASFGASAEQERGSEQKLSFVLDPKAASYAALKDEIMRADSIAELEAIAERHPDAVYGRGKQTHDSSGFTLEASVLGVGLAGNQGAFGGEALETTPEGEVRTVWGGSTSGISPTIAGKRVNPISKTDTFTATIRADNTADAVAMSEDRSVDVARTANRLYQNVTAAPLATAYNVAAGNTPVLQERVDASGALLSDESFARIAETAKDKSAWHRSWKIQGVATGAVQEWEATRQKVLAANGDRTLIARAMKEWEQGGSDRTGDIEKLAGETAVTLELPDEIAGEAPVYEQYIKGDPVAHARQLVAQGNQEQAVKELNAVNARLWTMLQRIQAHQSEFADPGKFAAMQANILKRREAIRAELAKLTPAARPAGHSPQPGDADFVGPVQPEVVEQVHAQRVQAAERAAANEQIQEIVMVALGNREKENAVFAAVEDELDDFYVNIIFVFEQLNSLKPMYQSWDGQIRMLRGLYEKIGDSPDRANQFTPNRAKWNALNQQGLKS